MHERFMETRYKHLRTEAPYLHNCQMINKARALVYYVCFLNEHRKMISP